MKVEDRVDMKVGDRVEWVYTGQQGTFIRTTKSTNNPNPALRQVVVHFDHCKHARYIYLSGLRVVEKGESHE